ncbi:MAG: arginine repressor [Melioribacteraceae bacterium]|nr:MAG: arginine repressor [Melioribacteraceae bacterium]
MSAKLKRQQIIKTYLTTRLISSQEQLIQLLKGEGVYITQATLSRDFADLGVVRTFGEYGVRYELSAEEAGIQISKLVGLEMLHVNANESMVVIRTLAGRAQGVAHYIDRLNEKFILGTIGGDDTVLIIPDTVENIPKVLAFIKSKMENDGH